MLQRLARHWLLWIALCLLWSIIAVVLIAVMRQNGHFTYAFDDAYIHMAIAKHFAQNGVWGVTPFEFSSSSSSLLWTLILAIIFKFAGVNEAVPLILNIIFATALLVLVYRVARRYQLSQWLLVAIVVLLPLTTPLVVLIFAGMEHLLQTLIVLSMVFIAAEALGTPAASLPWKLLPLAALLIATRYEGLFLIAILGLLFTLRFRWHRGLLFSLGLLLSGLSVVFIYGAISISHGWYLLPNSVLVKGTLLNFSSNSEAALFMASKILVFSMREPALITIVIGAVLLLIIHVRLLRQHNIATRWEPALISSVITILLILLHLQFASVGAFFRYEGYLFVLGVVVLGVHAQRIRNLLPEGSFAQTGGWAVVLGAVLVLLVWRSSFGLMNVGLAMKNNFDQQYQMARFIATYYQNSNVVLNDIGAVNLLADIHLMDTAALADKEVSDLILLDRTGKFEGDTMRDMAARRNMQIALVHNAVKVPKEWQLVGTWTLPDGFIVASPTVAIYAVVPEVRSALLANLRDYLSQLPADVQVKINE